MKPSGNLGPRIVPPPNAAPLQPDSTAPAFRYEVIDAAELAKRWKVPKSWILEATRTRAKDKIPCMRFGRYVRFLWGDPQLAAWFERRRSGTKGN